MLTHDMPEWLEPMAATLTQERFGTGGDWLFERKFDGIRLLAWKQGTTSACTRAIACPSTCLDSPRRLAVYPSTT